MTRFLSRPLLLLITTVLLAVAVLVVQRTGNVSSATLQEEPLGQTDTTPNSCRYGTSGIGTHANFVDDMRLGWIIDFGAPAIAHSRRRIYANRTHRAAARRVGSADKRL